MNTYPIYDTLDYKIEIDKQVRKKFTNMLREFCCEDIGTVIYEYFIDLDAEYRLLTACVNFIKKYIKDKIPKISYSLFEDYTLVKNSIETPLFCYELDQVFDTHEGKKLIKNLGKDAFIISNLLDNFKRNKYTELDIKKLKYIKWYKFKEKKEHNKKIDELRYNIEKYKDSARHKLPFVSGEFSIRSTYYYNKYRGSFFSIDKPDSLQLQELGTES